jgi:hypothetical protein
VTAADLKVRGRLDSIGDTIEAEHQAAQHDARSALAHALECGRLLLEAKTAVAHGDWLAWLAEHTTVTSRQSQRYMRLGRELAADPVKYDTVSHLTLSGALAQLASPRTRIPPPLDLAGDWEAASAWAQSVLDGPFTVWDFEVEDGGGWIFTKLMHQMGMPAVVAALADMEHEHGVPALRLASSDDLVDAVHLIVPHAKGTAHALPFDTTGMTSVDALHHQVELKLTAQRLAGYVLTEWDRRKKLTDEQYEREWGVVHARLLRTLDSKLARLHGEGATA